MAKTSILDFILDYVWNHKIQKHFRFYLVTASLYPDSWGSIYVTAEKYSKKNGEEACELLGSCDKIDDEIMREDIVQNYFKNKQGQICIYSKKEDLYEG